VLAYVIRRILTTIPLLLIGTFVIYLLVSVSSNPLDRLRACQTCDPAAEQRLIELYNLDQPIPQRYGNWMIGAVQGDMGPAISVGNQPAFDVVVARGINTARLAVPAFVIVALLAIGLGVYSAVRQYSKLDYVVTGVSFLGISLPTFVFGLLLQLIFAIWWFDWFGSRPFLTQGFRTVANDGWVDMLRAHVLPITTLVLVITASESRFMRASMLEVVNSDYIRTARAKGLPPYKVIFKHGLRNAMIPLVTIWAIDFAALLGGSLVTETIFSWPGLGLLLLRALEAADLNLVMGIVLFISLLVVVFNLIADLLYGVLDPRIRYE
jgi:peptide/nickel transport system permease protein